MYKGQSVHCTGTIETDLKRILQNLSKEKLYVSWLDDMEEKEGPYGGVGGGEDWRHFLKCLLLRCQTDGLPPRLNLCTLPSYGQLDILCFHSFSQFIKKVF